MRKLLVIATVVLFSQALFAILPDESAKGIKYIDKPKYLDIPRGRMVATWRLFTSKYPYWKAVFNEYTSLPHRAYGSGIPIDTQNIVASIKQFMMENPEIFPNSERLEVRSEKRRGEVTYVVFAERYKGLPVYSGRADFRIKRGRIVMFGADIHPDIDIPTQPALSGDMAERIAKEVHQFDEVTKELVILPSGKDYHLSWWLKTKSSYPFARWNFFIDAMNGELIMMYNDLPTSINGVLRGLVYPHYIREARESRPFPYEYITTDTTLADTTDEAGRFSFPLEPGTRFLILSELKGLYANVKPINTGRSVLVVNAPLGDEIRLEWNDSTGTINEINPYYHINLVHDFFKRLDPDLTAIDYEMPIIVNDTTPPTPDNAFWDGYGVHLGAGSSYFNNFALFADVIYHEYTHGTTQFTYPVPLPYSGEPGAINEGLSDYFACTITNDSRIGEGGLYRSNPDDFMRDIHNDLRMPDDWQNEPHSDGMIFSGALWDLRTRLGPAITDSLVHFARYGGPLSFDDYVDEMIVVDDDDGDLSNGTPHFFDIFDCFQRHGIGRFRIFISLRPLPDTEDSSFPYPVIAKIEGTLPINVERTTLKYSTDGINFIDLPFVPTGERNFYRAEIPPQRYGTTVWYYIYAVDTLGTVGLYPPNAPDSLLRFSVGLDEIPPVIEHTPMEDMPGGASPFRILANISDNLGIENVLLVFGRSRAYLDTVHMANIYANVYEGYINILTLLIGDSVFYAIIAEDSSSRHNVARFPAGEDFVRFMVVKGVYFDFETDSCGFVKSGDWEWGSPDSIPEHCCPSGSKLWGTNISGNYSDNNYSFLYSPPIYLSGYTKATLEFDSWWEIEDGYDGGQVKISTDGGASWELLEPIGGYPCREIVSLGGPGYSGFSGNFKHCRFDLSRYVGSTLLIGWSFKSDEGLNFRGWYIDNVSVAEKQVLLPPSGLQAESGWDRKVPLLWHPPQTASVPGFLGYNIYRSETPGTYPDMPINPLPITDTTFTDTGLVNMRTYFYRVKSLYTSGLSDYSNEVSAMPYRAAIEIEPDSFRFTLLPGRTKDTVLTIYNRGDHELYYEIFEELELPGIACIVPPSGEWRLLRNDPEDPGITMDLKAFYAQHNSISLYLMVTAYRSMGNPATDFVVGFILNTDMDTSSGDPRLYGADYIVAVGALPMGNAMILRYDPSSSFGWSPAGVPHWVYLPASGDTAGAGIYLSDIGLPPKIIMGAGVIVPAYPPRLDMADIIPNEGDLPIIYTTASADWIEENPIAGVSTPSAPSYVNISINTEGLRLGIYNVYLRINSNDRERPTLFVPVNLRVATGVSDEKPHPRSLEIESITPNPFNENALLQIAVPQTDDYSIDIFDILGRRVNSLNLKRLSPGVHRIALSLNNKPSGVYFVRLSGACADDIKQVILLK